MATPHSTLDGNELHVPQGFSDASAKEVPYKNLGTDTATTWGKVSRDLIANDAVNGDKIANDSINSEHYVDGSIDNQHVGNGQIGAEKFQSGSTENDWVRNRSLTYISNVGSIGCLVFGHLRDGNDGNDVSYGGTVTLSSNGTNMYTSNSTNDAGTIITSGTWRCLGHYDGDNNFDYGSDRNSTLWVRVG